MDHFAMVFTLITLFFFHSLSLSLSLFYIHIRLEKANINTSKFIVFLSLLELLLARLHDKRNSITWVCLDWKRRGEKSFSLFLSFFFPFLGMFVWFLLLTFFLLFLGTWVDYLSFSLFIRTTCIDWDFLFGNLQCVFGSSSSSFWFLCFSFLQFFFCRAMDLLVPYIVEGRSELRNHSRVNCKTHSVFGLQNTLLTERIKHLTDQMG